MKTVVLSAVCLVLLAGCETAGAGRPPPVGASYQEIEPARLRVTFRGSSRMSETEVRDRTLLRAAELTLERGYDWFAVTDRYGEVAPPTRPRFTIGVGTGSYGRRGGFDVGGSTGFGGEPTFVSTLEISLGRGPRPPGPDAYDARAVADTIRPRLS